MIFAKIIKGDFSGKLNIKIGALWSGPVAEKLKGLEFINSKNNEFLNYDKKEIKGIAKVVGDEPFKPERFIIVLKDEKRVLIEQNENNKALQCLILFSKKNNIFYTKKLTKDKHQNTKSQKVKSNAKKPIDKPTQIKEKIERRVPCPSCAESIKEEATLCPYCKQPIFSKNKGSNALLTLVYYVVGFIVCFYLISAFIEYQSEKDYDKIMRKANEESKILLKEFDK